MSETWDYVIVGAGSAGCVLAYRLSEDPNVRVLLVEAGGSSDHPFIRMPRGLAKAMSNMRFIWPYMTKPEKGSNDVAESWARGKTLGGSSAVNGMVYVRGAAADFDTLAEQTSDDWNWAHIAEAYRGLEGHELGAGPTRGGTGPQKISLPEERPALAEKVIAAGVAMGLERLEDINEPDDRERVGYAPRTIWKGVRQSAAVAFLKPAMKRPNLTVHTGVSVDRILFEGKRAVGITGTKDGAKVDYRAARDVIISAGTMASPAILQRSGVGPAALLQSLDIPVVAANEAVGANLFEHRGVVFQWKVPDALSDNRRLRGAGLIRSVLNYFFRKKGVMAGGAYDMAAYLKSDPSLDRPDLQFLMADFSLNFTAVPIAVEDHGGINFCVYPIRPASRGTVSITSRDADALPQIVPNFGSDDYDRRMVRTMFRVARAYVAQPPLADVVEGETRPGAQFVTDEEIDAAYLANGYANYHACGTCRMGRDEQSAIDPELKVRGVEGLRVVDTSIFPFMLAGNTNGPALALAWRAADVIARG